MFGLNTKHIAKGWVNDLLNKEEELYNTRIVICKACPLYSKGGALGPVCDSKKCINPNTGKLVYAPSTTDICGCSCFLNKKTRVKEAKCVLGKW